MSNQALANLVKTSRPGSKNSTKAIDELIRRNKTLRLLELRERRKLSDEEKVALFDSMIEQRIRELEHELGLDN